MRVDGIDNFDAWKADMEELAASPNVACKIPGLSMGDWKWTSASFHPYVLSAIDAFGVDRRMFTRNFPVDKLFSSYDKLFDALKDISAGFSQADRLKLFHGYAERHYRL